MMRGIRGSVALAVLSIALLAMPVPAGAAPRRAPLLGSKGVWFEGSGVARPRVIAVVGLKGALINRIHWTTWGRAASTGIGRRYAYRASGGYYAREVGVQLRAGKLGRCVAGGPLTYRVLHVRVQTKPGGRLGKWFIYGGRDLCTSP